MSAIDEAVAMLRRVQDAKALGKLSEESAEEMRRALDASLAQFLAFSAQFEVDEWPEGYRSRELTRSDTRMWRHVAANQEGVTSAFPEMDPDDLATMEAAARKVAFCSFGCCQECAECAAKPGTPTLCAACLERRSQCDWVKVQTSTAHGLTRAQREERLWKLVEKDVVPSVLAREFERVRAESSRVCVSCGLEGHAEVLTAPDPMERACRALANAKKALAELSPGDRARVLDGAKEGA